MADDHDLVQALKQGDEEAFGRLVSENSRMLYSIAYRMVGNHDDADEIAQETFVRVFRKIRWFRGKSSLRSWMVRIAINLAKNHLRNKSRFADLSQAGGLEADAACTDPGEAIDRERRQGALLRAVGDLPNAQRMVVTLRTGKGLSFKEIGQALGMSETSAKVTDQHAIRRLKERLNP